MGPHLHALLCSHDRRPPEHEIRLAKARDALEAATHRTARVRVRLVRETRRGRIARLALIMRDLRAGKGAATRADLKARGFSDAELDALGAEAAGLAQAHWSDRRLH